MFPCNQLQAVIACGDEGSHQLDSTVAGSVAAKQLLFTNSSETAHVWQPGIYQDTMKHWDRFWLLLCAFDGCFYSLLLPRVCRPISNTETNRGFVHLGPSHLLGTTVHRENAHVNKNANNLG